jgi:hypothetical protein
MHSTNLCRAASKQAMSFDLSKRKADPMTPKDVATCIADSKAQPAPPILYAVVRTDNRIQYVAESDSEDALLHADRSRGDLVLRYDATSGSRINDLEEALLSIIDDWDTSLESPYEAIDRARKLLTPRREKRG